MEIALFYSAEFVHVLSHADHVLALYDPERDDPRVSGSPDPMVAALCLCAQSDFFTGSTAFDYDIENDIPLS